MKTTIEKSNDLRHTINGPHYQIKIRLNDECKNGHQDFSITGTFWTPGKPKAERYIETAGCCHDSIIEVRPDLKPFIDLHLSTAKGVTMYAIANGFYHLKNSSKEVTIDYLRITSEEFDKLSLSEDETYFQAIIEKLGIPERWLSEANKAIQLLEEMTHKDFFNDSVKVGFTPLGGDKLKEVEQLIESGYYAPEKIAERNDKKESDKRQKHIDDLMKERDEKILKANIEFEVKNQVLLSGLSLDNFIYYNHTNEGVFNWNTSSYNKAINKPDFDMFMSKVDLTRLPVGITFKMK